MNGDNSSIRDFGRLMKRLTKESINCWNYRKYLSEKTFSDELKEKWMKIEDSQLDPVKKEKFDNYIHGSEEKKIEIELPQFVPLPPVENSFVPFLTLALDFERDSERVKITVNLLEDFEKNVKLGFRFESPSEGRGEDESQEHKNSHQYWHIQLTRGGDELEWIPPHDPCFPIFFPKDHINIVTVTLYPLTCLYRRNTFYEIFSELIKKEEINNDHKIARFNGHLAPYRDHEILGI